MAVDLNEVLSQVLIGAEAQAWTQQLAQSAGDARRKADIAQAVGARLRQLLAGDPLPEAEFSQLLGRVVGQLVERALARERNEDRPLNRQDRLQMLAWQLFPTPVSACVARVYTARSLSAQLNALVAAWEALVHFLGTVALCSYFRSGVRVPELDRQLGELFQTPTWSPGHLWALLRETVRQAERWPGPHPYPELPRYLYSSRGTPSASYYFHEDMTHLRRIWKHNTGGSEDEARRHLETHLPRFERELLRLSWLQEGTLLCPVSLGTSGTSVVVTRAHRFQGNRLGVGALNQETAVTLAEGDSVRTRATPLLVTSDGAGYLSLAPLACVQEGLDGLPYLFFLMRREAEDRQAGLGPLRFAVYCSYEMETTDPEAREFRVWQRIDEHGLLAQLQQQAERLAEASRPVATRVSSPGPTQVVPAPAVLRPPCVLHDYVLDGNPFVGRARELQQLDEWLADREGKVRVFCLCALGGSGKSYLSWQWFNSRCHDLLPRLGFAGSFWCSFYTPRFSVDDFLAHAVAYVRGGEASELRRRLTRPELENQLLAALRETPWLFVLDGLERLMAGYREDAGRGTEQAGPSSVADRLLLREDGRFLRKLTSPQIASRILITTRMPPAQLDRDFAPGPMDGVRYFDLAGLEPSASLELWRALQVPHGCSDDELLRLFETFGSHPLIISVLACAVRESGLTLEQWRQANPGFNPLADENHGGWEVVRSRLLHASARSLSPSEFRVLQFLSGFKEPTTVDLLAGALVGPGPNRPFRHREELLNVLESLYSRCLVGRDSSRRRYDLHPVISSYVWSRTTDPHATLQTIQEALLLAFSEMQFPEEQTISSLGDLAPFLSNFNLLIQRGERDRAWVMLADRLYAVLVNRFSARTELRRMLCALFEGDPAQGLPKLARRYDQGVALEMLSNLLFDGDDADVERAFKLNRWAGAIFYQISQQERFLSCRRGRAWRILYEGHLFETEKELLQILADPAAARHAESVWTTLALVRAMRGDASGLEAVKQGLTSDILRDRWALQSLAESWLYLGESERALELAERALELARGGTEVRPQDAWEWLTRGMALVDLGRWEEAEASLGRAQKLAHEGGMAVVACFTVAWLARLALNQGDHEEARRLCAEYRQRDPRARYPIPASEARLVEAELAGDREQSASLATEAYLLAGCDGSSFIYRRGLLRARDLLQSWKAAIPELPSRLPADASRLLDAERERARRELARPHTLASNEMAGSFAEEMASLRAAMGHGRAPAEAQAWWNGLETLSRPEWVLHVARQITRREVTLEEFYHICTRVETLDLDLVLATIDVARLTPKSYLPLGSLPEMERAARLEELPDDPWLVPSLRDWLANNPRLLSAYEVQGFTAEDTKIFLRDAESRLLGGGAYLGRWWGQLRRAFVDQPEALLAFCEALLARGRTLDQFLEVIDLANPDRIRGAFLRLDLEAVRARAENPGISASSDWTEAEVIRRLENLKWRLGWLTTGGNARKWWVAFESENAGRLRMVLRLVEELAVRHATITEFFNAFVDAGTDNIQANLHFLDFTRARREQTSSDREDLEMTQVQEVAGWPDATGRPGITDSRTLSEDTIWEQAQKVRLAVKLDETVGPARQWWEELQRRWRTRPRDWLRLLEELKTRNATATEFYVAHLQSGTADPRAVLHYLDYKRLKDAEGRRQC